MSEDQLNALEEFRRCAGQYISADDDELRGRGYALAMAAAELGILGLDPSLVTPTGYDELR